MIDAFFASVDPVRNQVRRIVILVVLTVALAASLLAAPVTTTGTDRSTGTSTTVLGQAADQAHADGRATLYAQSPMYLFRKNPGPGGSWWRWYANTSYVMSMFKPPVGFGATYYRADDGVRRTVRCYALDCPYVTVPPAGLRVVGVFHL